VYGRLFPYQNFICENMLLSKLNTFDTLLTKPGFQTFARLIEGTEIEMTLRSQSGITVFAPVDSGFTSLPQQFLDKLLSAKSTRLLLEVLRYHLVAGRLGTRDFDCHEFLPSEQGYDLKITSNGVGFKVNQAKIVLPDIETEGGMIHGIDELLIPGEIALVRYLSLGRSI
jgi:uncharacterized surface protein with fasciclin (FAS1) repeats